MSTSPATQSSSIVASGRIPLWVKLAYTAFVCVLVPYYWSAYGPSNFLYFCDVALFFTLAAMWTESPLAASMPAVGILVPQTLWCIDFLGTLIGLPVTGMTGYMFDENLSLATRGLSFFHFWLPFLLVWLVWRLGYDSLAFLAWTILAWVLMLICFFFYPPPPAPDSSTSANINYVYGLSDTAPQEWMAPGLFFAALMVVLPLLFFLPAHLLLRKFFGKPPAKSVTMTQLLD